MMPVTLCRCVCSTPYRDLNGSCPRSGVQHTQSPQCHCGGVPGQLTVLAYQRGRYARLINYNRPLDLPLHPQDKEWAEKVARGKAPS